MGRIITTLLITTFLAGCGIIPGYDSGSKLSSNLQSILDDFIESIEEQNGSSRSSEVSFTQVEIDNIKAAIETSFEELELGSSTTTREAINNILQISIEELGSQNQDYIRAKNIGAITGGAIFSYSKNMDSESESKRDIGEFSGVIVDNLRSGGIWGDSFPTAVESSITALINSLTLLDLTQMEIYTLIYQVAYNTSKRCPTSLESRTYTRSMEKIVTSALYSMEDLNWLFIDNTVRWDLTMELSRGVIDSYDEISPNIGLETLAHDTLLETAVTSHNIQRVYFEEDVADEYAIGLIPELVTIYSEGVYRGGASVEYLRDLLYTTLVVNNNIISEFDLDVAISQGETNGAN